MRQESIFVNDIKKDLLFTHYLDTYIALNEINLASGII